MKKNGYAYFVKRPRTLDDLCVPHLLENERSYDIVKTVTLPGMDYENFVTDMLADRQFIEDNCNLCSFGKPCQCILVRPWGKKGGILVIPENSCYVGWAANLPDNV